MAVKAKSWLDSSLLERALGSKDEGKCAEVFVHLGKVAEPPKAWRAYFPHPQPKATLRVADTPDGVKMIVSPLAAPELENDPRLVASPASRVRDAVGQSLIALERLDVAHATYDFKLLDQPLQASLLGLEIALYRFKRVRFDQPAKLKLALTREGKTVRPEGDGVALGRAVNFARHLINLPPNELNPVTYAQALTDFFGPMKNVTVETWDEARLKKEKCNLHLAVGQASATPPRLVRLSYRPARAKNRPPVALVGKGITFDSGGLDIKPASGMRWMKKDMGGSAAVVGVLFWAALTGLDEALDVFVATAENSIGDAAFRPGDVITARSGTTVEIHNTDAEGRLVLADALDVALERKPRAIIDVATLTGAIKVALGSQLTGLFASDEKLGQALAKAGTQAGDYAWTMPLVQRYRAQSNTPFADCVNSVDGFGGAITAALFLESFVGETPWAHLDVYAWKDSADGAWAEQGGSGQGVLLLAEWLRGAK